MNSNTLDRSSINYSEFLQTYGVSHFPNGYYWQVGEIPRTQGWILDLSVIESQLTELLQILIPHLIEENTPFKIARDKNVAIHLLDGGLGYINLGKIFSIYPDDDRLANDLAKKLITWTKTLRGPCIPTDRLLSGIVYTRYGSFNPVMVTDKNAQPIPHIYDAKGELIPDPYDIPFALPKGLAWPFADITTPYPPRQSKLLNYVYYPLTLMKPDAKGVVMKGLYFKKFGRIKSCLLKQGKKDMVSDEYGRDMGHRLQWQYELYLALGKDLPIPEVFDCFKDADGNSWLAVEFIKGRSLTKWIKSIYEDRCWRHLSANRRLKLLEKFLVILSIFQRMHDKGFIHRDITPENFLIDKNENIFLIDLELTWSTRTGQPNPPFRGGTPGHTSPEQLAIQQPTIKEDLYGIGGLMVMFFTNFYPLMFNPHASETFHETLLFFTGEPILAKYIVACQHPAPEERPTLEVLQQVLKQYLQTLKQGSNNLPLPTPGQSSAQLEKVVKAGLAGLSDPGMQTPQHQWFSLPVIKEERIGNAQLEKVLYTGWHTGMAGPLWLIAFAKKTGFSIKSCWPAFTNSWEYIQQYAFSSPENTPLGLYAGFAGMAVALAAGLESKLLIFTPDTNQQLQDCFARAADQLDLADGQAGQGLALLQCAPWLDAVFLQLILQEYIENILNGQQRDGSWEVYDGLAKKRRILIGLDHGVAGIAWFLLNYLERYPNSRVRSAVERALGWLIKISKWQIDSWSSGQGAPGVALVFIKAYEVFKDVTFKNAAVAGLLNITPSPARMDLSLDSGLAGLGEMYLEAARVFNESEWSQRADWIAQTLVHCFKEMKEGTGNWLTNIDPTVTADLFTGNSGILHFLLRCLAPEKVPHPLSLKNISSGEIHSDPR